MLLLWPKSCCPCSCSACPCCRRPISAITLSGHLYIFLFEFVLLAGLFGRGLMKFETGAFQFLYYFCYLPYLLLLVFTVRPFWLRHLFVLGL